MENANFFSHIAIYDKYLKIINNIKFTMREIEVIACLLHGKSPKGIADFLSTELQSLGNRSVETHIFNIRRKIRGSSKESIINFIENSATYDIFQRYYIHLLIQKKFTKFLSEIPSLLRQQQPTWFIVPYQNDSSIITSLIDRLLDPINLAIGKVPIVQPEPLKDDKNLEEQNKIYFIPKNLPKIHEIIANAYCQNTSSNQETLYIFYGEGEILLNEENLSKINYIDLEGEKNYHLLFLKILEKISHNIEIKKKITSFKEKYKSLLHYSLNNHQIETKIEGGSSKRKILNIISLVVAFSSMLILYLYGLPQKLTHPNKPSVSWSVPRQDHIFVGREDLLEELYNKLCLIPNSKNIYNLVIRAFTGLGGIGKTQLALQYIHHTKHNYTLKAWFSSENIPLLQKKYLEFAKAHGYSEQDFSDWKVIGYVKKWFADHPGWLIVFDNANNYKEIVPFLPESGGHVIITTRQREWPSNFEVLQVDVMSEDDAIKTIQSLTKRNIRKEINETKELVKTLEYLPLALAQAGAYIKQNNISIKDYLNLYQAHEIEMLADTTLPEGVNHNSVAVTWNISLEAIDKESYSNYRPSIAIELITVCAYLSPDKISRNLLLAWLSEMHPDLTFPQLVLNHHIGIIWKYSLINYVDDANISIHRLIQVVLRDQLEHSLEAKSRASFGLEVQWFQSLLRFFINNEANFKLTNSFQQLIDTRNRFKSRFKDHYNYHLAELDLIISSVYFNQEKYEDFLHILEEVDKFLQTHQELSFLKSKISYLYSAYFRKHGNFKEAEKRIDQALTLVDNIKTNKLVKEKDLKSLKAKILFNKANLCFAKNKSSKVTDLIKQEVKEAIKLIKEAVLLNEENDNIRDLLRSIELYGRLLLLVKNAQKVIDEFNKNITRIENIADERTKMLFYLTYSDAYVITGNFKNALEFCHKAKMLAQKLHLNNELSNITIKETNIKNSIHAQKNT